MPVQDRGDGRLCEAPSDSTPIVTDQERSADLSRSRVSSHRRLSSDRARLSDHRVTDRVRKVDASGIITTVAGDGTEGFGGDGEPGIAARLNEPVALAVTSDGTLFISDWGNQRVRIVVESAIV